MKRETAEVSKSVKSETVNVTKSAEKAAAAVSEYDDDDDDDDEYVVHNAFSEDGTMVAAIAAGKAGAKHSEEPAVAAKKEAKAPAKREEKASAKKAAPEAEVYEDDAEAYDDEAEELEEVRPAKKAKKAAAKARKRRDYEEYDEDDEEYPYGEDASDGEYYSDEYDADGDDEEYYAEGDDAELSEDEDEDGEEKAAPSFLRMVAGDAIFLVAVFAFFLVLLYIFPPYIVDGPSMQKTLVDKAFGFGYRYATPERGDIVIVNTGDRAKGTNGESFIKRVIAVPGDTIQCIYEQYDHDVTLSDGTVVKAGGNVYRVYLNGEMLYEPYAWFGDINTAREIKEPLTLGEDEYFVMGDNRFNSNDSRAFGPVSRADIKCTMMVFLIGKHDPE